MRTKMMARFTLATGLAALMSAAVQPTATAREGGTFVETISSDALVCRTTTEDSQYRVQALVRRDTWGANYYLVQVFENFGDVNLVMEAYGEPSWAVGSVRAAGTLIDPVGDPLPGDSYLSASFTRSAESTTRVVRQQEGNQRSVAETLTTPFELTGVQLEVTGLSLKALDCIGSAVTETRTFTTPATFVTSTRSFEVSSEVSCYLGDQAEVWAEVVGRELSIFVGNLPGPHPELAGSLQLQGSEATGSLTLLDADGSTIGLVPVTATLTQIGPAVVEEFSDGEFFAASKVTPYRLDLTFELGSGAQATACAMDLVTQRVRVDLPK